MAQVVEIGAHPRTRRAADRYAHSLRVAFHGRNLHIGRSRIVHAVAWTPGLDDEQLPVPACRQAFGGHGLHGELRPTRWPVTCRRCRRAAGEQADDTVPDAPQPTLF